jgi:hypothetical protein
MTRSNDLGVDEVVHFTGWRRSSQSTVQANNCVEVGAAFDRRAVRDTELGPTGPLLVLSVADWNAFVRLLASDA